MVQLHLNPIHAVVQLRPSLAHLKSGVSKRKDTVAAEAEVTVKVEPNEGKAVGPSTKRVITDYCCYEMFEFKAQNMRTETNLAFGSLSNFSWEISFLV